MHLKDITMNKYERLRVWLAFIQVVISAIPGLYLVYKVFKE